MDASRQKNELGNKENDMIETRQKVIKLLEMFSVTEEFETISKAYRHVDNMQIGEAVSLADKNYFRNEKLRHYLMILNELDTKIEPNFNFDDVPMLTVSPPPESGLPAGVDPESITDPVMKKEFEKNIGANRKKSEKYLLQKKLHKFNRTVTEQVELYIKDSFSNQGKDVIELNQLIDDNVKLDERGASLKNTF